MASKRNERRKTERRRTQSCTKKDNYPTMGQAERAASEARQRSGDPIYAYSCEFESHFHIGHSSSDR